MNLPFFLHKSLVKMVTKAKKPDGIHPRSVFHQGLIKILYNHALKNRREAIPRPRCRSKKRDRSAETSRGETLGNKGKKRKVDQIQRASEAKELVIGK